MVQQHASPNIQSKPATSHFSGYQFSHYRQVALYDVSLGVTHCERYSECNINRVISLHVNQPHPDLLSTQVIKYDTLCTPIFVVSVFNIESFGHSQNRCLCSKRDHKIWNTTFCHQVCVKVVVQRRSRINHAPRNLIVLIGATMPNTHTNFVQTLDFKATWLQYFVKEVQHVDVRMIVEDATLGLVFRENKPK